jgi:hypothetical protein
VVAAVAVAVDEVVLVVKVWWCCAYFWTVYPVAPVYFSSPLRMSTDTWTNCVEIVWVSMSCAVGWYADLCGGAWCLLVVAVAVGVVGAWWCMQQRCVVVGLGTVGWSTYGRVS